MVLLHAVWSAIVMILSSVCLSVCLSVRPSVTKSIVVLRASRSVVGLRSAKTRRAPRVRLLRTHRQSIDSVAWRHHVTWRHISHPSSGQVNLLQQQHRFIARGGERTATERTHPRWLVPKLLSPRPSLSAIYYISLTASQHCTTISTFYTGYSLLPSESTASQNYSLRPRVFTIFSYRIILIISLTVTLSFECCSETCINILFIVLSPTLSTSDLMFILTPLLYIILY